MKNILKYIPYIFFAVIILIVFRAWFLPGLITGGDFWSFFKSMYAIRPIFLYAWNWSGPNGIGSFVSPFLWVYLNFGIPITSLGKWLGLSWDIIERVWYLFPFLIINLFSSFFLFKKLFSNINFAILSSAIYTLNTYILMIVGGGQIAGIGIAYALFPIVLYSFAKVINLEKTGKETFKYSLIASIILSLQLLFDIRITYISLVAIFVYWVIKIFQNRSLKYTLSSFIFVFLFSGFFSVLLHTFWILPTIVSGQNPVESLGTAYSSLNAVKFFSFAKFEDAITLLHPNWPENIFGKVSFLKPAFLLLPILAFSSLLFVKKESKHKTYIIFFTLIALLGSFLAKGANDPFGSIYLWMFNHIPGFNMFRDPSKWYTLIALSYAMLISFSTWKTYEWIRAKNKFQLQNVFMTAIVIYFLYLIYPAISGQLTGLFKTHTIPSDYIKLEQFLSSQKSFTRTFWIPTQQRYGFYSYIHPTIPAENYFNVYDEQSVIKKLKDKNAETLLQDLSVKYVIVPYDSEGEIFLNDRKYDEKTYLKTIKDIKAIQWLKQVLGFGKIAVFEVPSPKDHFWSTSKSISLNYLYVSPVEYVVNVRNAKKGDLIVFSEAFDRKWIAEEPRFKIQSSQFDGKFDSFVLSMDGNYSFEIYYTPQDFVNIGIAVSIVSFVFIVGGLLFLIYKKT